MILLENISLSASRLLNYSTAFSRIEVNTKIRWGFKKCCFRKGTDCLLLGHPHTSNLHYISTTLCFLRLMFCSQFQSRPAPVLSISICAAECERLRIFWIPIFCMPSWKMTRDSHNGGSIYQPMYEVILEPRREGEGQLFWELQEGYFFWIWLK